jgi:endo-alpha-1,4-polygalactosaminidase (GH114 family)
MATRPMTQREIQKQQELEQRKKDDFIVIHNCSPQLIVLQIERKAKPGRPRLGFWHSQQNVQLYPKNTVKLPKSIVMMEQLKNLQAKGKLRILGQSEAAE